MDSGSTIHLFRHMHTLKSTQEFTRTYSRTSVYATDVLNTLYLDTAQLSKSISITVGQLTIDAFYIARNVVIVYT